MIRNFAKLARDTRGATAIEYALIASLIVLAMVGGFSLLGGGSSGMWTRVSDNVADATH